MLIVWVSFKANHPHIKKLVYFSDGWEGSTETRRTLWICVPISMILVLILNGCFLQCHGKSLCDGSGGAVKQHVAKRNFQKPLNKVTKPC